jgi:Tol biopolymer transport system component
MSLRPARFTIPATALLLCASLSAQVTQRVSVGPNGEQGTGDSALPAISADGRYVAFSGPSNGFVPGDTNATADVFVRDRLNGTTERVSLSSAGVQGNGWSALPSVSADARYVAFQSEATNLVSGDTNAKGDVFVRDRQTGTTVRVSVATGGAQANGDSDDCAISADGRFVAFHSTATNLVAGDTNGMEDVFVRDLQNLTTERVSISTGGAQGDSESDHTALSADGRYVVFYSFAANLVAGDTNAAGDVFVRDRQLGTTERVSVATGGGQGNGGSTDPSISSDGRFVTFWSAANDLVPGDTNGHYDVFLRDLQAGTTERVSVSSGGVQGNGDSWLASAVSGDGRFVVFAGTATNLDTAPGDMSWDIFLRDRLNGTTKQLTPGGGWGDTWPPVAISSDGRFVAFWSYAVNIVPADTNGFTDVFVYDRLGAPSFTSLCDPGVAGVIPCPCGNAPGGSGRGCDNSAATGGASLAAAGGTYLSSDTLVFTTSGEKPTATSVLLQGTASPAAGAVYGQGVRCVGGTLKRLFTKTASGGSITAPEFYPFIGDPTVSARSAAKGDPISPGQSRWYLVFYRDPIVLGGCPATSTFNATQTGRIDWAL